MSVDANVTQAVEPELDSEHVVQRRHPGRWISSALITTIVVAGVLIVARNPRFQWNVVAHYIFSAQILTGLRMTLELTAISMAIGIVLGTVLAVMRISKNPVTSASSAAFIWFFRGTPLLVQLIFWYNFAALFPNLQFPGFGHVDTNSLVAPFTAAIVGLGLNEAAYMSEIVRAGIASVGQGQINAGLALGMRPSQVMRTIILPQSMRVIIPPTGNQTIGMLKTTSLVSTIALAELLYTAQQIYSVSFAIIPMLITVSLWYLIVTSILMAIQVRIERHYGKGTRPSNSGTQAGRNSRLWQRAIAGNRLLKGAG